MHLIRMVELRTMRMNLSVQFAEGRVCASLSLTILPQMESHSFALQEVISYENSTSESLAKAAFSPSASSAVIAGDLELLDVQFVFFLGVCLLYASSVSARFPFVWVHRDTSPRASNVR